MLGPQGKHLPGRVLPLAASYIPGVSGTRAPDNYSKGASFREKSTLGNACLTPKCPVDSTVGGCRKMPVR